MSQRYSVTFVPPVEPILAALTEDERWILLRFMQGGLQEMGNGDWSGTIYGTGTPPGGDPPGSERDENGYLHSRDEQDYVLPIFEKLFPGREVYEYFPNS